MNKVIMIGRLCDEVELKHTPNGVAVATYRIAVNRDFKKEGQPEADFFTCVAWRNGAEFASKHLHKGTKIAIEGHLQTRNYDDKDGKKVYVTEIIVDRHEFCEGKKTNDSINAVSNEPQHESPANNFESVPLGADDDLPF